MTMNDTARFDENFELSRFEELVCRLLDLPAPDDRNSPGCACCGGCGSTRDKLLELIDSGKAVDDGQIEAFARNTPRLKTLDRQMQIQADLNHFGVLLYESSGEEYLKAVKERYETYRLEKTVIAGEMRDLLDEIRVAKSEHEASRIQTLTYTAVLEALWRISSSAKKKKANPDLLEEIAKYTRLKSDSEATFRSFANFLNESEYELHRVAGLEESFKPRYESPRTDRKSASIEKEQNHKNGK